MAILRKSALALAALVCLGVTVPVLAQDKASSDVKAAQSTLKDIQALGAEIKARQAGQSAGVASTPVAAPEVKSPVKTTAKAGAKKAKNGTAGKKKKKTP